VSRAYSPARSGTVGKRLIIRAGMIAAGIAMSLPIAAASAGRGSAGGEAGGQRGRRGDPERGAEQRADGADPAVF